MFKKDNFDTPPDKVNTVIGKETVFNGSIVGKGLIRIDGEAEGEINNKGDVIIGESGRVKVELKARHVTIAGYFEGSMEAEGKLELKRTATALGTFKANGLHIEEGAVLSGTMNMTVKESTGKAAGQSSAGKKDWAYESKDNQKAYKEKQFSQFGETGKSEKDV